MKGVLRNPKYPASTQSQLVTQVNKQFITCLPGRQVKQWGAGGDSGQQWSMSGPQNTGLSCNDNIFGEV